jgi:hypothetical protein
VLLHFKTWVGTLAIECDQCEGLAIVEEVPTQVEEKSYKKE